MWLYESCSKKMRKLVLDMAMFFKRRSVEFLNGTGVVCQNNNDYDTHFSCDNV